MYYIIWCLLLMLLLKNGNYVNALYEKGKNTTKFMLEMENSNFKVQFWKSMYKDSSIVFSILCHGESNNLFDLTVNVKISPCQSSGKNQSSQVTYQRIYPYTDVKCQEHILLPTTIQPTNTQSSTTMTTTTTTTTATTTARNKVGNKATPKQTKAKLSNSRKKRDEPPSGNNPAEPQDKKTKESPGKSPTPGVSFTENKKESPGKSPTPGNAAESKDKNAAGSSTPGKNTISAIETGVYHITLEFISHLKAEQKMDFTVTIGSKYKESYLSAIISPLLPFYGVMSLTYLAYAIIWLVCSCCNWKDLLRVQFWIGGVIALGMFENAIYYSEYEKISSQGTAHSLLYVAEVVSSAKRALARILVIIVSIGFGIVKPRLGQTLHKVLVMGGLYFLLASIEGCMRVNGLDMLKNQQLFSLISLTIVDVCICWWIFTSLVQTTRTLRIRKNVVKLTLYRHFTNTLIFTILASIAYMIYMIKETKFSACNDITTFWLHEALWPFLFSLILAVIMYLWRPSANSQRYAFTPLVDGEEEDDDMTLSDAFEGMKMRNKSETTSKNRKTPEDDLRWVEENIPSVPSTLLPTIDSDEEILTTKFEHSKMN